MKITKIEVDVNSSVLTMVSDDRKLQTVDLTLKNFWGTETKVKAFPTTHGPTYGSGNIQYFYFTNELGEEFDDDISKQINNFLFNHFHNIK